MVTGEAAQQAGRAEMRDEASSLQQRRSWAAVQEFADARQHCQQMWAGYARCQNKLQRLSQRYGAEAPRVLSLAARCSVARGRAELCTTPIVCPESRQQLLACTQAAQHADECRPHSEALQRCVRQFWWQVQRLEQCRSLYKQERRCRARSSAAETPDHACGAFRQAFTRCMGPIGCIDEYRTFLACRRLQRHQHLAGTAGADDAITCDSSYRRLELCTQAYWAMLNHVSGSEIRSIMMKPEQA